MSEIRNLTRNGETFYPLTCTDAVLDRDGNVVGEINDIFDISEYNASGTPLVLAKYASLSLALAAVPTSKQKGGMIIRYVQNSDNTYVQFRYMGTAVTGTPNPFLDTANWQGVDEEIVDGSKNLIESGAVAQFKKEVFGSANEQVLSPSTKLTFSNVFAGAATITESADADGNYIYTFTKTASTSSAFMAATPPFHFELNKRYGMHFKVSNLPTDVNVEVVVKRSISYNPSAYDLYAYEDGEMYAEFTADRDYQNISIIIRGITEGQSVSVSEIYINKIQDKVDSLADELEDVKAENNSVIYNDQTFEMDYASAISVNLNYSLFPGEVYYYEVESPNIMKSSSISYGEIGHTVIVQSVSYTNKYSGFFTATNSVTFMSFSALLTSDISKEKVKIRLYQKKTLLDVVAKPLAGKTINFLGDSITSLDYTVPTWWQYLAEKLGFTGVPYAVSGTTISKLNVWPDAPFCERYANMSDADAVVIMGGTNDGSHHPQIGSIDSDNITTLRGAMNVMLQGLFVMYPGKPILFITPPQRAKTYETYTGYVDISQLNDTDTLDFPQVVECIKQCCNRYSVPCLDLFNGGGFNGAETDDGSYVYYRGNTQQGLDDVHPSELGQKKLAKVIEQFLLDNI